MSRIYSPAAELKEVFAYRKIAFRRKWSGNGEANEVQRKSHGEHMDWHTGFEKNSSTIIQQKPATKRERERKNLQIAEKHWYKGDVSIMNGPYTQCWKWMIKRERKHKSSTIEWRIRLAFRQSRRNLTSKINMYSVSLYLFPCAYLLSICFLRFSDGGVLRQINATDTTDNRISEDMGHSRQKKTKPQSE